MPRLSRLYVRMALAYLVVGTLLGAVLLWHRGTGGWPGSVRWLPLHMEMLLMGWLLQLALGVAYWILPRYQQSRGNPSPAWAALILLNGGILVIGLGGALGWPVALLRLGRLAELGAVVAFATHAWPRVKGAGS